jgi:hypothetical protein
MATEQQGMGASPQAATASAPASQAEPASGLRQSCSPHGAWTWEEHELSEGYSCIVYDQRGQAIADHLDRDTAAKIAAAPELYEALERVAKLLAQPVAAYALSMFGDMSADEVASMAHGAQAALSAARGESQ